VEAENLISDANYSAKMIEDGGLTISEAYI
jgi:hypothetical protein